MLDDCTVLLADDDEGDAFLMQRAFQKAHLINPVKHVVDGQAAIDYLSGTGVYGDRKQYPFPFLVLLDLKMPKKNGFEVLEWVRSTPQLKRLLVVVLTSSKEHPDINKAYDLGANSYLAKPGNLDDLFDLVKRLGGYWLFCNIPAECHPCASASQPGPVAEHRRATT